ncbi:winged helix-turn-helix domain-containing protein [Mesorhizobium sp. AR07]|uniref:winged helix-turn-helix domain-containing protein n=1 Tax=Mesorhizobium sp. AR07 TaxID=2865838 RepID=UPI00215DD657|nr:winged helix-turn-helix domain-containing protein [Mesorhizobium sp. AR07]UVK43626.1 winged helix-turn-helix domain-containing protein [Mesorhizobium sp. AR07]
MSAIYDFGPFHLDASLGILMRGSEPTGIGHRAAALLQLLLDRATQPVAKELLFQTAWPGLAVEDSNLTVQIAAIRKVLDEVGGAGWIETLPRRGYRYVGPPVVTRQPDVGTTEAPPSLELPVKPSVVVLPFANLGDEPEQAYFTDGMVDDIITGLSRVKWIFVIGRGTTFSYKGRMVAPRQVGQELGVRYVLEGSVRKIADHVRINCQLVDATSAAQVWSERYDRKLDDVFALQDGIASSVVAAMEPGLQRAEIERVRRKRPDSLDAYELVLKAQPDVDSGMPEQVTRALVCLERSLILLPTYALAHANAAMCHHCLFLRVGLREEHRAASLRHADAAMTFGQDDARALTLAGFSVGMDGHDRGGAFAAFEAALALSPSCALTYILGSVVAGWAGEAERAIDWGERGIRLSPFDPWAFAAYDAQALGYFRGGRYEDAAGAAHKYIRANPAHSITYVQLAAALAKLGRLAEARTTAARVLELHPTFRYSRQFSGVNCAPALAASMAEALSAAGLPE